MNSKYNAIANEFAAELRGIRQDFPTKHEDVLKGAWRMLYLWCRQEKKRNPRFDEPRFISYITERL